MVQVQKAGQVAQPLGMCLTRIATTPSPILSMEWIRIDFRPPPPPPPPLPLPLPLPELEEEPGNTELLSARITKLPVCAST